MGNLITSLQEKQLEKTVKSENNDLFDCCALNTFARNGILTEDTNMPEPEYFQRKKLEWRNRPQEYMNSIAHRQFKKSPQKQKAYFCRGLSGIWPAQDLEFRRKFNKFAEKYPHMLTEIYKANEYENANEHTLLDSLYGYVECSMCRRVPIDIFRDLVEQTPQILEFQDRVLGWTLLHKICVFASEHPFALDIAALFLELNPAATECLALTKGSPLLFACQYSAPLPLIQMLVKANPRTVQMATQSGDTPLHSACCFNASPEVIKFLVMENPAVCLQQDNLGDFPLHLTKRRDRGVVAFLSDATRTAARVLMSRLNFSGPLPMEVIGCIAAYLHRGPPVSVEIAMLQLTLSVSEKTVLLRRKDIA